MGAYNCTILYGTPSFDDDAHHVVCAWLSGLNEHRVCACMCGMLARFTRFP